MFKQGIVTSILSLLALTSNALATTPATTMPPVFEGTYQCKGIDPYLNNKVYQGTVTVKPHNTVYELSMNYDTGESSVGTGGQYGPNLMSVVFKDIKHPDHIGLEQYSLTTDNKVIEGYWVYLGMAKLGKEVCQKTA